MEAWLRARCSKFPARVFVQHWFIRIEKNTEQDSSRSVWSRLWSLLNPINWWLSALHLSFGKVWAQVSLVHHCSAGTSHGSTCMGTDGDGEEIENTNNVNIDVCLIVWWCFNLLRTIRASTQLNLGWYEGTQTWDAKFICKGISHPKMG